MRGHVALELLTDAPDAIFAPGRRVFAGTVEGDISQYPVSAEHPEGHLPMTVQESSPYKGGLVVKFDTIEDRTIAERWRQRYVLVPVEELVPLRDDEVFVHELLGMAVQETTGTPRGTVTATYELPQGLTLDVHTEAGSVLVPYRQGIVVEVDRDARVITLHPDTGLFD